MYILTRHRCLRWQLAGIVPLLFLPVGTGGAGWAAGAGKRLAQLIKDLEDRLFAAEDARARRRGWQIFRSPTGFGRRYRDPRWDLVSECPQCTGEGWTLSGSCGACHGRGTIWLDQVDLPGGGTS